MGGRPRPGRRGAGALRLHRRGGPFRRARGWRRPRPQRYRAETQNCPLPAVRRQGGGGIAAAGIKGLKRNLDSRLPRYVTRRKGGRLSPSPPPAFVLPNIPTPKRPTAGDRAPGGRTKLNLNYVKQRAGAGGDKRRRRPQSRGLRRLALSRTRRAQRGRGRPQPRGHGREARGGWPERRSGRRRAGGTRNPPRCPAARPSDGGSVARPGRVGAGGSGAGPRAGAPLTFLPAPPPAPAASAEPPPEYM